MKLSSTLAFLLSIIPVSAKLFRLCCCVYKNKCDLLTTNLVAFYYAPEGALGISGDWWSTQEGAPYACQSCYAYARGHLGILNDQWIKAEDWRRWCSLNKVDS
ncbi:hypothetical protein FKW77_007452 [Venturia effusa]|uniref:Uncharacterized protein n=1 Tax=Venturia effusa TaxID=50376 RepID=A0A517L7M4_9PEZI|nr:hypothetical protein FKW77_007452 [Venturia effusa]